jgi:hypothetical protein
LKLVAIILTLNEARHLSRCLSSLATFHVLQGCWNRYPVDAKVAEVERYMCKQRCDVVEAVAAVLDIQLERRPRAFVVVIRPGSSAVETGALVTMGSQLTWSHERLR